MSTPPPLLTKWIAEGCPTTSAFVLGAIAESIAALGDPPQSPDPQWPAPTVEAVSQTAAAAEPGSVNWSWLAAFETAAAAEPGSVNWSWLAAFEATGTPRPPSVDRMLGKLLLKPATRAAYIAAVKRLAALL